MDLMEKHPSEDQWSKQQESKSTKAFKPGAALLASAIIEDTPQMIENETQGSPLQIAKVLEIRRNSYVLHGGTLRTMEATGC